uniref:phosphoserine phosphatase n=1 Tax=Chromera velia CCMP2878 TaxID=1169474 RepID=A0A0G4GDF3_9ALVE|eukprot:Cvel_639.t1-p1 / transcript=Cvel_639.t1 / gene=Cvel_639 / organism=Chromera_velia_CCMP2878 / gene_product=Phosphoserine phosphatase, putative / transcript_product=Phosphoserine phosphatase, putative / location=Cvel_scaffold19:167133-169595(-) / protein_length=237 / sequence_SO=supercontig / SO=protein_coding / is_pseudo=false
MGDLQGEKMASVKALLLKADVVCFDVDSTVLTSEAIDDFAAFLGKGEEVARLTKLAMEGGMKYEESLKLRLDAMQPSKQSVQHFVENDKLVLTDGVAEVIKRLLSRGTEVFLVSGGFREIIVPLAEKLGIGADHVFANTLLFKEDGSFDCFDPKQPTSRDMGKAAAMAQVRTRVAESKGKPEETVVALMVGDGATDLQARPPADAVIGYGGICMREKVKNEADWFITEFASLLDVLS